MSYIDYPVKCIACGLHYTVHSWSEDWHQTEDGKERSRTNGGVCPECGIVGGKMLFKPIPQKGEIFEVVGNTPMSEMTPRVAQGIGVGAATMLRLRAEAEKEEGA